MSRRGDGTVYLRGRIWWLKWHAHGVPQYESSKSADREEAQRQLHERLGEIAAGREMAATGRKATIADLCGLVVADYRMRRLRDLKTVEWRAGAHVIPLLGLLPASRFGRHQVEAYIEARRHAEASDATINRELAILRRGFSLALQEDPPIVRRAPFIPALHEDNVRVGFIEDGQYRALLMAMPSHLKCLLVVGYHLGCRLRELRKLRWGQVDSLAGEICLQRSQTKTKQPRTAPIYGDMAAWLDMQRAGRKQTDLVFHFAGRPIGSHLKGWRAATQAAGLPDLRFHDLRRSAVRNMERAGVPRTVAMKITGHRTEAIFRRYDIVTSQDLRRAAEKLAAHQERERSVTVFPLQSNAKIASN
jgi:integrase